MKYRAFGQLGVQVSAVGFGAASISGEGGGYSFGAMSEADAIKLIHYACERGVNVFDTAPIYGFGTSETRLGQALVGNRREQVYLVSKSGIDWDDRKRVRIDNSAATTMRMLEQSLTRLRTDQIDLFLVHWPDPDVDIRETVEVLQRAKEDGKIAAFGLSNTNAEEWLKASEIGRVDAFQSEFSLFNRAAGDGLFALVDDASAGFMSWGTLAKGILTGRVTPERKFDQHDVRSHAPWWVSSDHRPHHASMSELLPLLSSAGHTPLQLALGYVLQQPQVSTALCGARTEAQLDGLVDALDNLPSAELVEEACRLVAAVFDGYADQQRKG